MSKRPSFPESFAEALALAAKHRGAWAYLPYWLIASLAVGVCAAKAVPAKFWQDDQWGVSTTFYGGLLAFDGLLLAIGWNAFSKIYEIISSGDFALFLQRNGLLNVHLLFVDLAQFSMVVATLSTGLALIAVLCHLNLHTEKAIMAVSIGASCYAIVKAVSATRAMQDLLWENASYVSDQPASLRIIK